MTESIETTALSVTSNYLDNTYTTNDNLYLTIMDHGNNERISEYNNLHYIDSLPVALLCVLAKQ